MPIRSSLEGNAGCPTIMFSQAGDFRSAVVNTDRYGFRWTVLRDGTIASVGDPPKDVCRVLTGDSRAFGVGATSDATTLASVLSGTTGRPWLNFGARAHCTTQELLRFMKYADVLP